MLQSAYIQYQWIAYYKINAIYLSGLLTKTGVMLDCIKLVYLYVHVVH